MQQVAEQGPHQPSAPGQMGDVDQAVFDLRLTAAQAFELGGAGAEIQHLAALDGLLQAQVRQ
ncbi:hypothetical protein D3C81_2281610 [compost metagenome]